MTDQQDTRGQGWTPPQQPQQPPQQPPTFTHYPVATGAIVMSLGAVVPKDTIGRIVETASFGREILYMVDWYSTQPPEYPIVRRVMRRTEFRIVEEG